MNNIIPNVSLLAGVALVGAGVAMVSVPAALVTVGALIIISTFLVAHLSRKG